MKRPLACIGLGVLAAMALAAAFPATALTLSALCLTASAALFALRLFLKRKSAAAAVVLLSASVGALMYTGANTFIKQPLISEFNDKTVYFSGLITSRPYTYDGTTRFNVRTSEINGEKRAVNISVAANTVPSGGAMSIIEGKANLQALSDNSSYNDARHIFFEAYISQYNKTYYTISENDSPPITAVFYKMRAAAEHAFKKYLPYNEASLCTAMLTGDKTSLDSDVRTQFGTLGIAHLLAVSGLHLSVAAAVIFALTDKLIKPLWASCALRLAGVFTFAAMTGFGFAVKRAFVMFVIMTLADLLKAKSDPLNSLGAAVIIICLDPFSAGDIGFLWSCSCTAAIILFAEKISARFVSLLAVKKRAAKAAVSLAAVCLAAMIGSAPFIVAFTQELSPYTLIANMLAAPMTGVIILCGGMAALLVGVKAAALSQVPMIIAGLGAKYLIFITNALDRLPFSSLAISDTAAKAEVIAASGLAVMYILCGKHKRLRLTVVLLTGVLLGAASVNVLLSRDAVTLSVMGMGSGMTVIMKGSCGTSVLCACGDKGRYSFIRDALSGAKKLSCLIDLPPEEYEFDYGRRIIGNFGSDIVISGSEEFLVKNYSWYRYCGGMTMTAENECVLYIDAGNSNTLTLISNDNTVCEYLCVYGNEILIWYGGDDIPEKFRSPDIAVISDKLYQNKTYISKLDKDACVVAAAAIEASELFENGITAATGNCGSVDIVLQRDGSVDIENH